MNIDLKVIQKQIGRFLFRFHLMIFSITIVGSLAFAVFILNGIVNSSGKPGSYVPSTSDSSFDQATIDKLKTLRRVEQGPQHIDTSSSRIDPFTDS